MEYEIKPAKGLHFNLKELWDFRELIYFFTLRDIKIKYKQTVLGALWAILQPLLLMVVFTLFFSRHINLGNTSLPYPVFVFTGLLFWNIFATGLATGGNSMVSNSNIIRKIYFPRLIIPVSSVLATLLDFLMTLVIFCGLLVWKRISFEILPLAISVFAALLITTITTFGLASLLAALNVKYRDFRYVIPFMIQVLLFVTPVIYPVNIISVDWLRNLLELNPIAGAIDLVRLMLSGEGFDSELFLKSLLTSILFLITGITYFRKTEYYFADLA